LFSLFYCKSDEEIHLIIGRENLSDKDLLLNNASASQGTQVILIELVTGYYMMNLALFKYTLQ